MIPYIHQYTRISHDFINLTNLLAQGRTKHTARVFCEQQGAAILNLFMLQLLNNYSAHKVLEEARFFPFPNNQPLFY
ncbi:hypothetical protein FGO68_gene4702 [Halteria grandinella]|uniref:Uncharacterized protein n=1 Tax=Halteria grandinella TaxID=5974 RepID=A0A8J8T1B3_HALGN|nr:hypothetical protein FGO68_gene4702 [Halteria grandinella]